MQNESSQPVRAGNGKLEGEGKRGRESGGKLKIRRVLLSVSNKDGIIELAEALSQTGAELVATGRTAQVLREAGCQVVPIEEVSGSPEAFQGRMKTLSFPVCSGILYRRGDPQDEEDLRRLRILPIDCVVVNFYPFEGAVREKGVSHSELIEKIDIGGPTLVRAAAKNSPHVLVLTSPHQYSQIIRELQKEGEVSSETVEACSAAAWERVMEYDVAIAHQFTQKKARTLRYGENPHQKASVEVDSQGPIAWDQPLTSQELSYNNILDLSSAYTLVSELRQIFPQSTGVVIVKHNNPCGVCVVPKALPGAQKLALTRAWEGDPVSSFGGVLIFTDPLEEETATWLAPHFVELVAAPDLQPESSSLKILLQKRKNLKAILVRRLGEIPLESQMMIPGGKLFQTADTGTQEELKTMTRLSWPKEKDLLARFGIAICRALKSNALAIVREIHSAPGVLQLVGAGQGQPNRVDALKSLAIPRAQNVLRMSEGSLGECVLISDAFFPFRDTVDAAHAAGIRFIVQPGGSLKDAESIAACDEHGVAMAFTGVRHFKH